MNRHFVRIRAVGEKNELSGGCEVWLLSASSVSGTPSTFWDSMEILDGEWVRREDENAVHREVIVSTRGTLRIPLESDGPVLTFLKHPWSGKVEILSDEKREVLDLYASVGGSLVFRPAMMSVPPSQTDETQTVQQTDGSTAIGVSQESVHPMVADALPPAQRIGHVEKQSLFWRTVYGSPIELSQSLWRNRDLIRQFTVRNILSYYRGTYLGILWSFFSPLFLLAIYSFVFGVVFNAGEAFGAADNVAVFPLALFCGMIVFGLFSDCAVRSPALVLANPNYVKKVVFPLEILPVATFGSSLFHACISFLVFLLGYVLFIGTPPWTAILLPVIMAPLFAFCLGVAWFLAALGVFIRDMDYAISIVVQFLFFASAIFFPISAVPGRFQIFVKLNPIALIVEQTRQVLMWGHVPNWMWLCAAGIVSVGVMLLGSIFFMSSKHAFADVV